MKDFQREQLQTALEHNQQGVTVQAEQSAKVSPRDVFKIFQGNGLGHLYHKFTPGGCLEKRNTPQFKTPEDFEAYCSANQIDVQFIPFSDITLFDIDMGKMPQTEKAELESFLDSHPLWGQTLWYHTAHGRHYCFKYHREKIIPGQLHVVNCVKIKGHESAQIDIPWNGKCPPTEGRFFKVVNPVLSLKTIEDLNLFLISKPERDTQIPDGSPAGGLFDDIADGGRHKALLRFAGVLRNRGFDYNYIYPATCDHNTLHCKPPLEGEEIKEIKDIAKFVCTKPTTFDFEALEDSAINEPLFPLTSFAACFVEQKPREWLVDGLLIDPVLGCINGDAGVGKTFLLIDMAVCLSIGKDWMGRKTKQCSILILDEESGSRRLMERIVYAANYHDVKEAPIFFMGGGFDITDERHEAELKKAITEKNIKLLLIDSFSQVIGGKDENSASEMNFVMNRLKAIIRETGCSVIFLHHLTKTGSNRGSSAIRAAVDFMISVSKSGDFITLTTKNAQTGKTRDTAPLEFQAQVNFNPSEYLMKYVENAAAAGYLSEDERLILTYLLRQNNQSKEDISKGTGIKDSKLRYAIEPLERKGYVKKQDDWAKGRKAYYSIVPKSRETVQSIVDPLFIEASFSAITEKDSMNRVAV